MLAWSVLYGGKEQLEGAWCETAWCLAASTCSYCSRIAQSPPTPPSQQISESNSIVHVNCDHTNVSNGTCKQSWMWQFDCFSLSLDFRTGPVYVWRTFGYYFVLDTPLDLTLYSLKAAVSCEKNFHLPEVCQWRGQGRGHASLMKPVRST